jgi:hypothetical protein
MGDVSDPLARVIPPVPKTPRPRKQQTKAEREAPVLHDCLKWLHERGIYCWRNNSGTLWANGQPVTFGYPGSADILGVLPDGRFLAVECKSPTGKQSDKQKAFEAKIVANHGVYILARSVEDLKNGLA